MEHFVTSFGLSGAVILALVGTLLWIARKIFTGDLVTRREYDELKARADRLEQANDNFLEALQDFAVTAHTAPIALRAISKVAEKKAGDE